MVITLRSHPMIAPRRALPGGPVAQAQGTLQIDSVKLVDRPRRPGGQLVPVLWDRLHLWTGNSTEWISRRSHVNCHSSRVLMDVKLSLGTPVLRVRACQPEFRQFLSTWVDTFSTWLFASWVDGVWKTSRAHRVNTWNSEGFGVSRMQARLTHSAR